MFKAVLFDLDGTLVDSVCDLMDSVNYVLNSRGYPTHSLEEYRTYIGDGMKKLIERALPQEHRNEEYIEDCRKQFLEHYSVHCADKTHAYKGMADVVETLHKNGIKTAVVTNKAQKMAELVVEHIYGNVFDFVLGQTKEVPCKPNPQMAHIAMKQLGAMPCECAFVGDSGNDVMTAINSGCTPVGVLWGYRDRTEHLNCGAKFLAETPQELLTILMQNG